MNYKKIYIDLILKAQSENRIKIKGGTYYEKHHFIPRCIGGDNSEENLILLTAREHLIAHKLLVEIYPNNSKIFYALSMMTFFKKDGRDYRIGAREYDRIRVTYIEYLKLKPISIETRQKTSVTMKKKAENGDFAYRIGRIPTQETKDKMSRSQKKRDAPTEETKSKISKSNKDKPKSETHRASLSSSATNREHITCPWCGFVGHPGNLINHHFDNCKQNPNYVPKEIVCPHCGKVGTSSFNMNKWHFDNCKHKL